MKPCKRQKKSIVEGDLGIVVAGEVDIGMGADADAQTQPPPQPSPIHRGCHPTDQPTTRSDVA